MPSDWETVGNGCACGGRRGTHMNALVSTQVVFGATSCAHSLDRNTTNCVKTGMCRYQCMNVGVN